MAKFTVEGIPWEELTEEQHAKVRERATNVVSEIVSNHVQSMIDDNAPIEEIKSFLGIKKEVRL